MAITTVKSTYSLDVDTVHALEKLALHWSVPKSEAMRRAIRQAADQHLADSESRLAAYRALKSSLKLTPDQADAWVEEIKAERRASTEKMMMRRLTPTDETS